MSGIKLLDESTMMHKVAMSDNVGDALDCLCEMAELVNSYIVPGANGEAIEICHDAASGISRILSIIINGMREVQEVIESYEAEVHKFNAEGADKLETVPKIGALKGKRSRSSAVLGLHTS